MISRGWNHVSQCGVNTTLNLAEASSKEVRPLRVGLPNGTFCNLARMNITVPGPASWDPSLCTADTVTVGHIGEILHGLHPGGEVIVLHAKYPAIGWAEPKE